VFLRRNKLTFGQRLRGFFWPRTGWKRAGTYLKLRLVRLPGTPHSIAAGFALGTALCFTPLVGVQLVISMMLAVVLRASVIASVLGTMIGNPWTFPFIWWLVYTTGTIMLGQGSVETLPETLTLTYVFDNFLDIFLPMLLGSVPIGIIVWVISYLPLRKLVSGYQTSRRQQLSQSRVQR
jgi:uncharacterized protein